LSSRIKLPDTDEGLKVYVIYLDFAKAFDKVPHHRLLDTFKSHGIHGKVFNWMKAWSGFN